MARNGFALKCLPEWTADCEVAAAAWNMLDKTSLWVINAGCPLFTSPHTALIELGRLIDRQRQRSHCQGTAPAARPAQSTAWGG